jgi:hypothetical protein
MITINSKYPYRATGVVHKTIGKNNTPVINFTIGDNVRIGQRYKNLAYYTVTVFDIDGLDDFKDGDLYTIREISSISNREYAGRVYTSLTCKIVKEYPQEEEKEDIDIETALPTFDDMTEIMF